MSISTAFDASSRARGVAIKTQFRSGGARQGQFLPQRVAIVGQGATASTFSTVKAQLSSADAVGEAYGFGSPLHLAACQLFPANGDGIGSVAATFYPLDDASGATASAGDVTPSGTVTTASTFFLRVGGVLSEPVTLVESDTVADMIDKFVLAIGASPKLPVTAADGATTLDLTAKWQGESGNDLVVEVVGPTNVGVSFAVTQPTGGATNPDVDSALAQMGDVFETLVVNCLNPSDSASLAKYATFNEGRWSPLVRRPFIAFTGNVAETVAAANAIPETRKTDRTNSFVSVPGSSEFPLNIAARAVARVARQADNNPPNDYGRLPIDGLQVGTDAQQWDYPQRDQAIKTGVGTTVVRDGVPVLADVVTFYHPDGQTDPAYRYVVDIIKLQNIIYRVDAEFDTPEWDGAPLIPDDQPTANPAARKPSAAKARAAAIVDELALDAIISDPEGTKAAIESGINAGNAKRLDLRIPVKVSGNTNQFSVDLDFGFFFGSISVGV